MVPAGNKAKRLSSVNHTTITIHHHHHHPSMRIYVNKIKNRITVKIKAGYYLELLTPETMNYLEVLKVNANGENVPHLEIAEVVLEQRLSARFKSLVYAYSQ